MFVAVLFTKEWWFECCQRTIAG